MISCILDPGPCFEQGLAAVVAAFPLGQFGLGMLAGAALGKFGVGAVLAVWAAMKSRRQEPDMYRHPDDTPPPKKRRPF